MPLTENDFQKEAQEAATKIQATFRSYKVRKEVRLGSSAAGSDTNLTDDTDNQRTEMKEADDAAVSFVKKFLTETLNFSHEQIKEISGNSVES